MLTINTREQFEQFVNSNFAGQDKVNVLKFFYAQSEKNGQKLAAQMIVNLTNENIPTDVWAAYVEALA